MNVLTSNSRRIKEVLNPQMGLSKQGAAALNRVRERRFARMDREEAMQRSARPTEDIRALKAATNAALGEAISGFHIRRQQILETFKPAFARSRPDVLDLKLVDLDLDYDGPSELHPVFPGLNPTVPPPRLPEGACELWWARTTTFSSFPEITVDIPDAFVHIFGHIHYGDDDLRLGSVGYIEEYELAPDRFPMIVAATVTPTITPTTTFEIATELRISGILSGSTGCYHWLWCADDKWCKCSELIRQTAFLSTGEILASRAVALQKIDLENVLPSGQANPPLTGGFPALLRFRANLGELFKSGTSILVQIETRYDLQLEGDADIWFRRIGGSAQESVPSMQNAVLFQSQPMCLRARA